MATYAEQIAAFENKHAANLATLKSIMDKAAEDGSTLDGEQQEEFDNLTADNDAITKHLDRLKKVNEASIVTAKQAKGETAEEASEARRGPVVAHVKRNVEKGIIFTRLVGAKYLAREMGMTPVEVAKAKFADTPEVEMILKAPVAAGTTTDSVWAGPLVTLDNATGEFIEMLRTASIIGRIPGLRRVPFNIKVPRATGDPTVNWVGEGKVKPVSSMAFDSVELKFAKVAGIVPITEELMRFSNPSAEALIRDALVAAVTYLVDRDFLDPSKAATDVSPASITNGVSPVVASGTTSDALRADLGSVLAAYLAANMGVGGLVLVMTSTMAMRLSLLRNALGNREFPDIGIGGGTLEGIPVITSENIVAANGSPADGGLIVAINAPEIMLADDGGVNIDVSREATLQMDTSPDSPWTATTVAVSLWQHNMVGIKAERFINWLKRRSGAVQYINGARYS